MAYFSNGSEGDNYMAKWCCCCENWKDLNDGRGSGCPIWDVHLLFNYEAQKNPTAKQILDMLIPTNKESMFAEKCSMFGQIKGEIEGQGHFEFTESRATK